MAQELTQSRGLAYKRQVGLFGSGQTRKTRVIKSSSLVATDAQTLNEQQKIYWRGRLALHKKQRRQRTLNLLLKILLAILLITFLAYTVI